ncbi:hypothetical protein CMI38_03575 [Candidatus Pacearchaeota archaeon]|nr:hypothetical protein [Candidatus Pacearchaeota archaeon]|tara:strand:- start:200 stop:1864 length:1665 start_codon:yes stop_codon:yes gene_type:complete
MNKMKQNKDSKVKIVNVLLLSILILGIISAQASNIDKEEFINNLEKYDWNNVNPEFLKNLNQNQIYDNFDKAKGVWNKLDNNNGVEALSALQRELSKSYGYNIKLKGLEKTSNGKFNSRWEGNSLFIEGFGKALDLDNKISGLNEIELVITQDEELGETISINYKTSEDGNFEIFHPVSIKSKMIDDNDYYEIAFDEGKVFINGKNEHIIGDSGILIKKGDSILTSDGRVEIKNTGASIDGSELGVYEIISDTRGILGEGMEAKKSGYAIVKSHGEPNLVAFDDEPIDLSDSERFGQYQNNYIRIGENIMEVNGKDKQVIQLKDYKNLKFKEDGKNSFITNGGTNIGSGETEDEIINNPRRPVSQARYNIDEIEVEGLDQKYQLIKSDIRTEGPRKGFPINNGRLVPIKGNVHMGNLGTKIFDANSGQKVSGTSNFEEFDDYLDSKNYNIDISLKADSDGFLNLKFPSVDDKGKYTANYRFTGIDDIVIKRTGRVRGFGYSQYSIETYKQGKLIDSGKFQFHDGGYIHPEDGIIIERLDGKKLKDSIIAYPSRN